MLRQLGFFSIALALVVLLTYAQPLFTAQPGDPTAGANSAANPDLPPDSERSRNLTLQPEARKLSRRVGGDRFNPETRSSLILEGVLETSTAHAGVQIVRSQNARGERVEIRGLSSDSAPLVWTEGSGFHSLGRSLTLQEKTLTERLAFDSVDYFILAQLRGASYYIVARNVRSERADDYDANGPWDVIRVDDPEEDPQKRPLSQWRLYYLSRTTGLIDKIISEASGERTEARLSEWKEQSGEEFPTKIIWSNQNGIRMTFTLIKVLVTQ
jgi:hypothetical protein